MTPLRPKAQAGIAADTREHGIDVAFNDPLYRSLATRDTHRIAEIGDAIALSKTALLPLAEVVIISKEMFEGETKEA